MDSETSDQSLRSKEDADSSMTNLPKIDPLKRVDQHRNIQEQDVTGLEHQDDLGHRKQHDKTA